MSDLHLKTASLLEALADEADAREAASTAATTARAGAALNDKLAGAIGGEVPEDVRAKLANDPALQSYLAPLLDRAHFEPTRPLGGPSEKSASPSGRATLSIDEQLEQANAHFVNVVMGRS